jgi:formylglycine-generating enzyme required for sulfatase activity
MAWIPRRQFSRGSDSDQARPDEKPVHRDCPDGFWMDKMEVTHVGFCCVKTRPMPEV